MQTHQRNTSFEWVQPEPPYQLISNAQAQAYREIGGFVLPDAFSRNEVEEVITALDPIEADANKALASLAPGQPTIARQNEIVFQAHIVLRSEVARRFSLHSVFQALCHDLIGSQARLYWDQLVYKRPGTEQEFPWHQDNGYTYVEPQQYLTCWVALSDATINNGCPWIAPGVHKYGTLQHRWTDLGFECMDTPDNARPLEVPAGSIAVFSSLTPHRTGPNLTNAVRKSYILQYAPDGAMVYPRQGEPAPANDSERQYLVCADSS